MSNLPIHNVPSFRALSAARSGGDSMIKVREEILKQLQLMEDTKVTLKVMEADRQRLHFGAIQYHSTGIKQKDDQMMSNFAELGVFILTIIDYYQQGVNFYYKNVHDLSRVYSMLKEYLFLWAKHTHLDPDMEIPPMADFIAIDDYLSKIHPDHELNEISVGAHQEAKLSRRTRARALLNHATSNAFRKMGIDKSNQAAGSVTGFQPTRYTSLLNQFHESVWR